MLDRFDQIIADHFTVENRSDSIMIYDNKDDGLVMCYNALYETAPDSMKTNPMVLEYMNKKYGL